MGVCLGMAPGATTRGQPSRVRWRAARPATAVSKISKNPYRNRRGNEEIRSGRLLGSESNRIKPIKVIWRTCPSRNWRSVRLDQTNQSDFVGIARRGTGGRSSRIKVI
jgi:hypothetical protein